MKKTLIKIFKLLSPYKWWMILASFIGFLTIGSSIGLLMTSAYIIAKAALHPHIGELQVGIVGVRFFGITRGVFRYVERLISHDITFKLLAQFRVWFFKSIEPLVPSKTGKFTSGDLLSRVVSDVESLEHIFIRVISPPLIAIAVGLLMAFIFLFFDVTLVIAFLVPYVVAGIGIPYFTFVLSKKLGEQIILLRARLTELSLDGIEGKNELISFGKVVKHSEEFSEVNNSLIKLQRKMRLIEGMNESLIGLMMNIAVIAVFIVAAPLVNSGIISGTSLSVLALGTMASFEAVLPIPFAIQHLNSSIKAGDRLFQITDKFVEKKYTETHKLSGQELGLKNISFSYNENENVIDDISIKINSQKKIAIIGGSGAGKSSIINLLLNFWEIDSGSITIDKIDYEEIAENEIRKIFSVVPQKIFLFSDTIKGNLIIAKPSATDKEIWTALEKSELKEFVEKLPNKLNTWIGNQGKQLSGGERKRIAIARAILKDSPIFLCDEITADLDAVNELKIMNTLHSVTKEKSLILITHRLIDMDKFDSIYLLENGKVISAGTHDDLLSKSIKYKRYFIDN